MSAFAAIAKALSDQGRLRIVRALERDELCACQLTELLGLAPSTVSKHLALLKASGLLLSRKKGTWIYYRLNHEARDPMIREWLDFAARTAHEEPDYKQDRRKLAALLKLDPEQLCCKQRCR